MNWWDDNMTPHLVRPEVAGTAGAILGWLKAPGETVRMQAFNLLAGIAAAVYVAPYVTEQLGVTSQAGKFFAAFILGLIGMNLLSKAIELGKNADLLAILKAWLPQRKPSEPDK